MSDYPPPPPGGMPPGPPPGAPPPPPGMPPPPPSGGGPQLYQPPPASYGAPPPVGAQPMGYAAPSGTKTNTMAIVSLVSALVGWLLCGLGPIAAVITGFIGRGQINKSGGRETGAGMAMAGIIIGILEILFGVIIVIIAVAGSNSDSSALAHLAIH